MWSMGERVAESLTSRHKSGERFIPSQDDAGWYGTSPGVRMDDTGIWIRHAGGRAKRTREEFLRYADIRKVRPVLRRSMGVGWQVLAIIVWLIMVPVVFVAAAGGSEWVDSELGVLALLATGVIWLTGWLIIPIIGSMNTYGMLAITCRGKDTCASGVVNQRTGEINLRLRSDDGPLPYREVYRLAGKISSARQRVLTETPRDTSKAAERRDVQARGFGPRAGASESAIPQVPTRRSPSRRTDGTRGFPSRFDVMGELGRGGMATVYLAMDRRVGREVAVKVLHENLLNDRDAVARFTREAKLIAGLEHPNILGIYGIERLYGGRVGLIMPYVRGGTLRDLIRTKGQGGLDLDAVARITGEILRGLAFAHRKGVVHRDIKPGNIFIVGEIDRVLIGDFGIARAAEGHTTLTQTGTSLGTPNYMAPEQIDSTSEVDGRADLYAVGMLMWEMLTGVSPWGEESLFNVIFKQKTEDLAPPTSRRGKLSDDLLEVWQRATRKNPDHRWATSEEMLEALARAGPNGPSMQKGRAFRGDNQMTGANRLRDAGSGAWVWDQSSASSGEQPTRKWDA